MLEPTVRALSSGRVVLASGSPSRADMIKHNLVNLRTFKLTFCIIVLYIYCTEYA